MSDQKNTTETPNIDDYLLKIDVEDNHAPSQTTEQGLDMDFLNQLGGDTSANPKTNDTAVDEFDLDSLDLGEPNNTTTPTQHSSTTPTDDTFNFLNVSSQDNNNTNTSTIAGVVVGATGLGATLANTSNNTKEQEQDTNKKSKSFFSGRFGKKEKPTPQAPKDNTENFAETLLANKTPKKGLFSRLNKKDQPTPSADILDSQATDKQPPTKATKKPFGGFGKKADQSTTSKARTPRASRTDKEKQPKKASSPDNKKKQQLLLGGLLCVVLLAVVAYLFLNSNTPEPAPVAVTPPAPAQIEPPAPTEQTPSILPNNNVPAVNPDEILNAEIPEDPALVKEEIDRLNDTGARLDEQGKIIEEQLTLMEDLTTAKAEQIALLEKQIAELEKQKATVGTPTSSEQPAPAPQQ